jgi:hypothetical protein
MKSTAYPAKTAKNRADEFWAREYLCAETGEGRFRMRNPAKGSIVMVAAAKPVPQVHHQLQALQRPFQHV